MGVCSCGSDLSPAVATKVAPFARWVLDQIRENATPCHVSRVSMWLGSVWIHPIKRLIVAQVSPLRGSPKTFKSADIPVRVPSERWNATRCPEGRWQCPVSGVCITSSQVCDGHNDCPVMEDGAVAEDEVESFCGRGLITADGAGATTVTEESVNPIGVQCIHQVQRIVELMVKHEETGFIGDYHDTVGNCVLLLNHCHGKLIVMPYLSYCGQLVRFDKGKDIDVDYKKNFNERYGGRICEKTSNQPSWKPPNSVASRIV